MSDADRFDACYAESRDRLLLLAFALTGDLSAARGAVRDAFVSAWHRWPQVGRLEEVEPWVREQVLHRAQRRHALRMWHRDRVGETELRATLDALAALSAASRRALLLARVGGARPEELARDLRTRATEAEERAAAAAEEFAGRRSVAPEAVGDTLAALAGHLADQRWSRAPIVRRAGATRRRTHTAAGALLVVATLVGGGLLVTDRHGVHPTLSATGDRLTSVPSAAATGSAPPGIQVTSASLLSRAQLTHALGGGAWRVTGTDPKQGMTFPCQRRELADPRAPTSLVRNFVSRRTPGRPQVVAVQAMELSSTVAGARRGYASATAWFAGCSTPQIQLLAVRRVDGLADRAQQYVLRGWHAPVATYVVGVARTGQVTTVTLTRTSGRSRPDLPANLRLLASAARDLCSTTAGGLCPGHPIPAGLPVPRAGSPATMLGEWDLPPAAGVIDPWVGTTPRPARHNLAATGCDRSSFSGPGWRHATTRSFVVPDGGLPAAFGITETVGRLPAARARRFVRGVSGELASCPHREPGTTVHRLGGGPGWGSWQVRTKVSGKQTLTFLMGIVRRGGAVAQVGFVPDGRHTMSRAVFVALVHRAGERLRAMP